MPAHLGKHAQAKSNQAVQFADAARSAGFTVDVSARVEDSLVGAAWPEFLTKCKFTVGMKGGASIADPYGLMYTKVESIRLRQPNRHVTSESLRFLRRRDGKHMFTAISPRLFEAAAAGTCQVLRPDNYMGVLEPWKHYIPLAADHSNIAQVFAAMANREQAEAMVKQTQATLIESQQFSYQHLVNAATEDLLGIGNGSDRYAWTSLKQWLLTSAQFCESHSLALHDAVISLIRKTQKEGGAASLAASKAIQQQLQASAVMDCYKDMADASQDDHFTWQLPWIPRLMSVSTSD
jgi:hypothetical protein